MNSVVQLKTGFNGRAGSGKDALCELLVAAGKLLSSDVERALRLQREQDDWETIGSILVKLGLVSEKDVAESLAQQLGLELVASIDFADEVPAGIDIEPRFLKHNRALVLDQSDADVMVAMANPQDQYVIDALRLYSGKNIIACLGMP